MFLTPPVEHDEPNDDDFKSHIVVMPLPDCDGFEDRNEGVMLKFVYPHQTICIPLPETAANEVGIGIWSIIGELMWRRALAGEHLADDVGDDDDTPPPPTDKCPYNFPPKL